jgi:ABC-type nickel/cobalt efflux system permease component RcnA
MLMRQEFTLARTELHQSLLSLMSSMGTILRGVALLFAGFLLLLAAAVFGLALLIPVWLAALGLGVVISIAGWWLVERGRRQLKNAHLAPSHLSHALGQDKNVLLRRNRS